MLFPSLHKNPVTIEQKKQLKNELDVLKKEYSTFMESKNCATGLGWDETKQTIVCSQKWWDEHLAVRTILSL